MFMSTVKFRNGRYKKPLVLKLICTRNCFVQVDFYHSPTPTHTCTLTDTPHARVRAHIHTNTQLASVPQHIFLEMLPWCLSSGDPTARKRSSQGLMAIERKEPWGQEGKEKKESHGQSCGKWSIQPLDGPQDRLNLSLEMCM